MSRVPSFDVESEVERQELRNAVDQASRELANCFDFKGSNSSIKQQDLVLAMRTASKDRLRALTVLLEERLVRRQISVEVLEWGKIEQASSRVVAVEADDLVSEMLLVMPRFSLDGGELGVKLVFFGDDPHPAEVRVEDRGSPRLGRRSCGAGAHRLFLRHRLRVASSVSARLVLSRHGRVGCGGATSGN